MLDKTEQSVKGILVTAMWRCRKEEQVTILVFRKAVENLIALVSSALSAANTRMGFVNNNELRASANELCSAAFRFDVVETDYREWVRIE